VRLNPGDHVCALYQEDAELAAIVGDFLADGLRCGERCWYLPAAAEAAIVRDALALEQFNVESLIDRGALAILSSDAAYAMRGAFDPEETMHAFSTAIEQALADGYSGFRAAANMSWALDREDSAELLIAYEALLRSLFESARATGLCLYDRRRMPMAVIAGAVSTHPLIRLDDGFGVNEFYDPRVRALRDARPEAAVAALARLERRSPKAGRRAAGL